MWKLLDKLQNKFINDYNIDNLYDELVDLYELYPNDTKVASKIVIDKFKRIIEKNKDVLSDTDLYKANKLLNRTKISNNEILEFLVLISYANHQKELDEYEDLVFTEVAEDTYTKEVNAIAKETGKNPHKFIIDYKYGILLLPNSRGYIWNEYVKANMRYNAGETYRYMTTTGSKGLKDLLLKQKRRQINKKKDNPSEDKYSGAFDEQTVFLANQIKLQAYKDMGIVKAKFLSISDNDRTQMCKSLHNQVFYIDKVNEYKRYSENAKAVIKFKTIGLKVGQNLPPINDHFHWCRSTITYVLEE